MVPPPHNLFDVMFVSPAQDQITITGYEHKAIAAKEAIQHIVDELEEMISEDITLDSRVHARIIGARGKGIRKIMDEFKVRLPRGQETPHLHHHAETRQH